MSKNFKSQDYFRYKKLGTRWRRPKGLQSKMRLGVKGAGARAKTGYRTSKKIRYLERGIFRANVVRSPKDLEKMQEGDSVIIASALGKRKVAEIAREAEKRKIRILNKKSVKSAEKREEKLRQLKELKKKEKKEEKKAKSEHKEGEKSKIENEGL